jgi:glycosyltransferase involved in cell wall biosynthesis
MACGVPVVQPNHGAFPEMIERTGGGLLATSERGPDVAEALHELWTNPARAAALGRRAAEGVRQHYTVTHMAERVLQVYEEAVGRRTQSLESVEPGR